MSLTRDNWLHGDDGEMIATEDTISHDRARRLYGAAIARGALIQVCAGEWRRESDGRFRFWRDPEWDK